MKRVSLKITFEDLLGQRQADMTDAVRRERWDAWLRLAARRSPDLIEAWTDVSACHEGGTCRHLDGRWCRLQELPATVNPYLSYRTGSPGMACMGAAHEVPGAQRMLFDEPF